MTSTTRPELERSRIRRAPREAPRSSTQLPHHYLDLDNLRIYFTCPTHGKQADKSLDSAHSLLAARIQSVHPAKTMDRFGTGRERFKVRTSGSVLLFLASPKDLTTFSHSENNYLHTADRGLIATPWQPPPKPTTPIPSSFHPTATSPALRMNTTTMAMTVPVPAFTCQHHP